MNRRHLSGRTVIVVTVIIALLILYYTKFDLLQQLEFKLIDAKFRLRGPVTPGDEITIINIDKRSLNEIGGWPWGRRTMARLIRFLSDGGARVIGMDVLFASPSQDPESDRELVQAIRDSGRVVLGYFFSFDPEKSNFQSREDFEKSLRNLSRFKIPLVTSISGREPQLHLLEAFGVESNIPEISSVLAGCGYYNVYLEKDGSVRRVPLFVQALDKLYPCFAVAALKEYYGAENLRVTFTGDYALDIDIGPLKIPTDGIGRIFINYYGPNGTFNTHPAWSLLAGKVPEEAIRDKIVLVGGTSIGDFEMRVTPFSAALSSVELQATCVDNMLHSRYLSESSESVALTIVCIIVFPLLVSLAVPRSGKTVPGFLTAVALIAAFLVFNFYLFAARDIQANTIYPLLAVCCTCLAVSMHTGIVQERRASLLRKTVSEMGMTISSVINIDSLLPQILDSMLRVTGATRGMLLAHVEDPEGKRNLHVRCVNNMEAQAFHSPRFSNGRKIISLVQSEKKSLVVAGKRRRKTLALTAEDEAEPPHDTLCVPLLHRKAILGIIYMETQYSRTSLWREDIKIIESLSSQAAIAIQNASMYSTIRKAEEKLKVENIYLKHEIKEKELSSCIIGNSETIQDCLRLAQKAAASDITVLIEGETGTGKELVAHAIHFSGSRKNAIFIAQNCSAFPESLLESELFGHRKGAFTGAVQDKKGLFEIADGGTIFLDEVGDMTPPLQSKLLRVLQEGTMRPVGGINEKRVDLRVISATNKDLAEEVRAGRFREDLFYRLNAFTIHVPPLRRRRNDIPILATHFIEQASKRLNKKIKGVSKEAILRLIAYDFPGNIRELENEIEQAVVMAPDGAMITTNELSDKIMGAAAARFPGGLPPDQMNLKEALAAVEKEWIIRALNKHSGNKTKSAEELGISRKGLSIMLKRLKIDV